VGCGSAKSLAAAIGRERFKQYSNSIQTPFFSMSKNTEAEEAKNIKQTFDGGITEEKIAQWKKQHRKVIRIDVTDGDELHVGYFHRPSLETMGAVSKVGKDNEMRGAETLFKGCWLGGSEYLLLDSVLFVACTEQLNNAFASCMSSLKNL